MATTGIAAAGLVKRIGVNAGIRFAGARSTATGSTTARFPFPRFPASASRCLAPRSAAKRFTAGNYSPSPAPPSPPQTLTLFSGHAAGGTPLVVRYGSRLLPVRCAPDAPPPPADAAPSPPDTPPTPQPDAPAPSTSRLKKLWTALQPLGFSMAMLAVAVSVGVMASKEHAWALYVVTLCEKSEKVHKVLSHLLPILIAIFKSFW
jgi:hypothetical protein